MSENCRPRTRRETTLSRTLDELHTYYVAFMTEMLESESLHASEIQDLQPSELSQITEIKILDAEAFASWWESLDRKTQDRLAKDYRTGFREAARRNRDEIAALTKAHL